MRALIVLLWIFPLFISAQSISNTYNDGDIPTSLPPFDPLCNGPLTTLPVELPSGGPWIVTSIDIEYEMLAQNGGWKSHQRSRVYCQNTERDEAFVYAGTGDEEGVQEYSRSGASIANNVFAGGTALIFEMRAWRTSVGTGCNTTYNRVNNFTWTITVHYTMLIEVGSVGIGTTSPDSSAVLDLKSFTKGLLPPRMTTGLRMAIEEPATGLIVYDTDLDKLFCFTGSSWIQIWTDYASTIRDADNDTKIQVEETPDEDVIRFNVGGSEGWVMKSHRLEPVNPYNHLFIGVDAGLTESNLYNIAIGNHSFVNNDEGDRNIGLGHSSLYSNTSGSYNIAIGQQALERNTSGDNNIALGHYALFDNEVGNDNTGLGYYSLSSNDSGNNNTGAGQYALYYNVDGHNNTALGEQSGLGAEGIRFTECTFVGSRSYPTVNRTNVVMLGYGISNSECTGNNQVLLGNTAITSIRAEVTGITAYSDARYKTNISEDIRGLDFIKRLRPVSYNVRPTELHKIWGTVDSAYQQIDHSDIEQIRFSGFIAQEVEQAAIESNYSFTGIEIPQNEQGTYALRYTEFILPMVKAIQEQQTTIDLLQNQNFNLDKAYDDLTNKYILLEEKLQKFMDTLSPAPGN